MDLIKELGTLALASRLKRLSDIMMRGVTRLYEEQQVEFHPRWFPVVYLLKTQGPMSVTVIAEALGMTHPAINQTAGQLSRHDLINSRKDKKDERRRILSLSKKGRDTVNKLEPLWDIIKKCSQELINENDPNFLNVVENIEGELIRKDMYERVNEYLLKKESDKVEIVDYKPSLKQHFKTLNYEWLSKYFEVEECDEKILSDPNKYILKNGGHIFFAGVNDKVIGTVAILNSGNRTYELAKMAVTEKWQGYGIGKKLALAVIDRAQELGAHRLILATSPKLERAGRLYRSLGFVESKSKQNQNCGYQRCTIFMELKIKTD